MSWRSTLEKLGVPVYYDEPLARHTTLRIGGPADAYVQIPSVAQLTEIARIAGDVPVFILGRGSNLLISDTGYRGIVAQLTGAFDSLSCEGRRIQCGSGVALPRLAKFAAKQGLGGLEFAMGVPGSVGGGLIMNAGAWQQQLSDTVREIQVMTYEGEVRAIRHTDAGFGYRQSNLDAHFAIVGARFEGVAGEVGEITRRMQEFYERKIAAQPFVEQNAGCMFRNPPGDSAGRLIDACGLKGLRVGDVEISSKHANFILNHGAGTAAQVMELMGRIQETVRATSGILLESEVKRLGFTD